MQRDIELKQLGTDYASVLFRRESRELSPRRVSLEHVDFTDWYPVDRWKVDKYIQDAFQQDADGTLWGIKHSCTLFRLGNEQTYRIGDGYHRIAAQLIMIGRMYGLVPQEFPPYFDLEEQLPTLLPAIIDKVRTDPREDAKKMLLIPAVVKENATFQDLWNERTASLIGQHEHVRFARLIQLCVQEWPKDWIGFPEALNQVIEIEKNQPPSNKWKNSDAVTFILDITKKWHMQPLTLKKYWELSERLHRKLIPKVRIAAQKDELSITQAIILASALPGNNRDWQLTIYRLLQTEKIQSDPVYLQNVCTLIKNLIPYYYQNEQFPPEDLIRLVSTAYTLWNSEKTIKQVTQLRESFSQLTFAPWWNTHPETRTLALVIFRKAVEENLSSDQMKYLLDKTIKFFLTESNEYTDQENIYISEESLPTALKQAKDAITHYSPEGIQTSSRSTIIYPRSNIPPKPSSGKHPENYGPEHTTQIIHHLIRITIRSFDMLSVNPAFSSSLGSYKYGRLQRCINQLRVYAEKDHINSSMVDEVLRLVESIDLYLYQVPIKRNHI